MEIVRGLAFIASNGQAVGVSNEEILSRVVYGKQAHPR